MVMIDVLINSTGRHKGDDIQFPWKNCLSINASGQRIIEYVYFQYSIIITILQGFLDLVKKITTI